MAGYDSVVPIKYAQQKGIEIYPVDHHDVIREYSPRVESEFIDSIRAGMGQLPTMVSIPYNKQQVVEIFDQAYTDPKVFQEMEERMPPEVRLKIKNLGDTPKFKEEREQGRLVVCSAFPSWSIRGQPL